MGGTCVAVLVGTKVAVKGKRTRRVTVAVAVTMPLGVEVSDGKGVEETVSVGIRVPVGEGTKAVTACCVSAATVSMLENAKSTILTG